MSNSEPLHKRPSILIVEDEQLVAMDMEMQLLAFGFEVVGMADTGKEALRLAAVTQPDLVLMDVKLRGPMDGVDAAEELQRRATIPIVFVTAFGSQEALRRVQAVGYYGYLTKPYRPEDLREIINAALKQHGETSSRILS